MKVGSCGVLDLSRVYPKTPFEPMFYSWWNCPLTFMLLVANLAIYTKWCKNREKWRKLWKWVLIWKQGLSHDLEIGCLKLAIVKFVSVQIFKGGQYTQISTINMYKFIKIRHDILIQCHGNYMEMKIFKLYAWDWHLKKILTKSFGCPEGCFLRVWVSKKTPRRPAG